MILKYGSSSNSKQAVRALLLLFGLPLGTKFTLKLKAAIKEYQKQNGLVVDGIAGPATLSCMCLTLPEVKYLDYSGSAYVKAIQALVGSSIDGKYGKNTRANVIAFQVTSKLAQTGDVNQNDWLALFGCDYVKTGKAVVSGGTGTNTLQPVDYKQGDKKWKNILYTITGNKSQTIGSSGCGPTSMADIQATWVDKNITPVEMCEYSIKHGHRTKDSGTAWAFFPDIAVDYGYTGFVQTKSMSSARNAIKDGAFVVASMGPGYWTSGGHFICLWKTDDTYMYANDPASSTRKKQKLGPFEEQRKQFFIFYKPVSDEKKIQEPSKEVDDKKAIIDISKWQGDIDFDALKNEVSLVIARASCGSDKDVMFDKYAKAMNERGIPFGVYCYSYAGTDAKAKDEAQKIIQYASKYNPLFYVMDAEESKITNSAIATFAEELRKQGANRIGCYVAHNHFKDYNYEAVRSLWDFTWIPRYGSNNGTIEGSTKPNYRCDLWQYTSTGKIKGISGNVDMNTITGSGKTLKWFLGKE